MNFEVVNVRYKASKTQKHIGEFSTARWIIDEWKDRV